MPNMPRTIAKAPPAGTANTSAAPAEGEEKALEEVPEALPALPVGEEPLPVVVASAEPDEVELPVAAGCAVEEVEEPNLCTWC